jgi:hypothetical protein
MLDKPKPYTILTDYVTGREVPNVGAEENRQRVERFLVEQKGYDREDIEVDAPIHLKIGNDAYDSTVDLVVKVKGVRFMVIKCAPGALASRHREILAAARLLDGATQIPFSVVTDGNQAQVLNTLTGQVLGEGMTAVPSKEEASKQMDRLGLESFPDSKKDRERIIFRAYDEMNVNVRRRLNKPE